LKTIAIDAGVATKWVLPDAQEPYKQEAVSLLRGWTESQIKLIVPKLANALSGYFPVTWLGAF
jgi:hypothetical protein